MVASIVVFAMTLANCLQFFLLTGPPPFAGTGQPARFTLNVMRSSDYWSLGVWSRILNPTLHSMTPPMVHIPGVNSVDDLETGSAASAPIPSSGTLEVVGSTELGFETVGLFGEGAAAGIAYDPDSGLFGILTTNGGMYFVEEDFSTVVSHAVFDTVNGYDIQHTTDATFFGTDSLVGVAWNKTVYGANRVDPGDVSEKVEWKEFRESSGDLEPVFGSKNRMRLFTSRAKAAYTLSVAMNDQSGLYSVVSVPSPQVPKIVVSEFAADHMLARENVLTSATDAELDLSGYYPVGAEIVDGTMYLLSKTYQSLLVIDMEDVTVTATYELPELGDYHGIAAADGSLFILSDLDGTDTVFEVTMP